jgi:hypothetical protein
MPKERNKADGYHEKDTSQPLTIVRNTDINGIKLSDDSKNNKVKKKKAWSILPFPRHSSVQRGLSAL